MLKTRLLDDFYIYTFTGQEELNILILVNNGKVLLIDTGYPEIARELRTELEKDNLIPEIIINSHYHPDHINGNYVFSGCEFMGSEFYKQNFELFEALNPDVEYIKPKILLKDSQILHYGLFELKFLNLKGHCQDCLVTIIKHPELKNPLVHAADLIMFSNDGKHSIPYLSYDGDIEEHIQSLETLNSMKIGILLPSHGIILKDDNAIAEALKIRIYYLQKLRELGKNAKVDDCLLKDKSLYNQIKLHDKNLKNIFG